MSRAGALHAAGPRRSGAGAADLVATGIGRRFGDVLALDRVDLSVRPGRTVAVVGPSGCGKSTLLRVLAGLEPADSGRVTIGGRDVTDVPAHRRGVGLVFQDHALFPHLDVAGNVAFGLVEAGWPARRRRGRVEELLSAFGLEGLAGRDVDALSGGERQRVALARALAPHPEAVLLDEPLASLDRTLRERLARDLADRLRGGGLVAVFVTHDQEEALTVGDELAVMRAGRIVQYGPAARVPSEPVDTWVAGFLGHRNVFSGRAATGLPRGRERGAVVLREGYVSLAEPDVRGGAETTSGARWSAEVRAVVPHRTGLDLELQVSHPSLRFWWRGAERELARVPAPGDRLDAVVPEHAWWPLDPAEPERAAS